MYNPILTNICTCTFTESTAVYSGAIQINYVIILYLLLWSGSGPRSTVEQCHSARTRVEANMIRATDVHSKYHIIYPAGFRDIVRQKLL